MLEKLLHKISELQIREKKGKNGYVKGLFPSQRVQPFFKYKREDNSVFFTASTLFVLNNLRDLYTENEKDILDNIIINGTSNFHLYQNKNGLKTYNFWQTQGQYRHFPNSNFLSKYNYFKLPDDIDTTSMVYLSRNHTEEDINWLKEKATKHANLAKLQVKNTLPGFRNLHAYSSWFGEKMPIEFDVCVHTNFLYFVFKNQLPLNKNDEDTLELMRQVVHNSLYFRQPFRIAPNYPNTSVILYHLARLVAGFSIPELNDLKEKLIKDIEVQIHFTDNKMEKIILSSSLMKLGKPGNNELNEGLLNNVKEIKNFEWFTAGFLSVFGNPLIKHLAGNKLFHMKFRCEAFNLALVAEYELLKRKFYQ